MNARSGTRQMAFGSALIFRAVYMVVQDARDHRDLFGIGINVTAGLIATAVVFVGYRARKRAKLATVPA